MRRTVIVIEPGSFQSAMSHDIPERLAASLPPGSPFKPIVEFTERTSAREERHARDPKILARAVYRAVQAALPGQRRDTKQDSERLAEDGC